MEAQNPIPEDEGLVYAEWICKNPENQKLLLKNFLGGNFKGTDFSDFEVKFKQFNSWRKAVVDYLKKGTAKEILWHALVATRKMR